MATSEAYNKGIKKLGFTRCPDLRIDSGFAWQVHRALLNANGELTWLIDSEMGYVLQPDDHLYDEEYVGASLEDALYAAVEKLGEAE